jgi:hypothetical protein
MAKKSIVSINCEIPGGEVEYIDFDSKTSLLDWDIIIFNPHISYEKLFEREKFQGKTLLSEATSFTSREKTTYWRREIREAVEAGKQVFVFLDETEEVYGYTGEQHYSGIGKTQTAKKTVAIQTSLDCLPITIKTINTKGKGIVPAPAAGIIGSYWREFGAASEYRARIESEGITPLLHTKNGEKIVGGIHSLGKNKGHIIILPYLDLDNASYYKEKPDGSLIWTKTGETFGKKLIAALFEIYRALEKEDATPMPEWARDPIYDSKNETQILSELLKIEEKIKSLEDQKIILSQKLETAGIFRRLLFENGKPLEHAIIEALKVMGFDANGHQNGDSEFDVVFQSAEGRFLGEAEGRDNKPISIDKLRQLEMNIHEDLAREEISEPAHGVLFGNAHRLQNIHDRTECFTTKCLAAVKRNGAALVRTWDLFPIALYLSTNTNEEFAANCRQALLEAKGEVVVFPPVPTT